MLRIPLQILKSWRRHATYEFSCPIGVFKQIGTFVPKYSSLICQLTLHCMVAGAKPRHMGARCWPEPVANKPRDPNCWTGPPRSKHNGIRALRKFPDARNITLQCNVIFFINQNLPHCPKYANRNNNNINNCYSN
jgi:hypothetical protein